MSDTTTASTESVLIKGGEILERSKQVDTVIFDKTGTLTEGRMRLSDLRPTSETTETELLRMAAAVEDSSEHPVGTRTTVATWRHGGTRSSVVRRPTPSNSALRADASQAHRKRGPGGRRGTALHPA